MGNAKVSQGNPPLTSLTKEKHESIAPQQLSIILSDSEESQLNSFETLRLLPQVQSDIQFFCGN